MTGFRISRLLVVVTFIALALGSISCASTVRLGGPEHSCSPGFEPSNELGTIAVQQRGPGYGIQWGVYPTLPAVTYTVDVYVNNRRDDHKVQTYPPHGRVNANQLKTGDVFRLEGQAVDAAVNIGYFYLQCLSA